MTMKHLYLDLKPNSNLPAATSENVALTDLSSAETLSDVTEGQNVVAALQKSRRLRMTSRVVHNDSRQQIHEALPTTHEGVGMWISYDPPYSHRR